MPSIYAKGFKKIIRAKAEQLAVTSVMADLDPLAERLENVRAWRYQAGFISDRRKADRDRIEELRKKARDEEEFIAQRLGFALIRSFYFVKEHEKHLTKKHKKGLGL